MSIRVDLKQNITFHNLTTLLHNLTTWRKMSSNKINIGETSGFGTHRIDVAGFPKIKNPVSRSTVHRLQKKGIKEVDCDPACNVKSQLKMAENLYEIYGQYGDPRDIARLEEAGLPYVVITHEGNPVVKDHMYCVNTGCWWIENIYWKLPNKKRSQNTYEKYKKRYQVKYDVT